jgi:hypothetical protein
MNKIKLAEGRNILFRRPHGPTPPMADIPIEVDFDAQFLETANSAHSTTVDLGPSPRPTKFRWEGRATPNTVGSGDAPVAGAGVGAYIIASDDIGIHDDLVPTDRLDASRRPQHIHAGTIKLDRDTVNRMEASGTVEIFGRYISLIWYNELNRPLGLDEHYFVLRPITEEKQDG